MCRNWIVVSGGDSRKPNDIVRLLFRQHYLGIVMYHGRTELAYMWGHYYQGEDRDFTHTAERVLRTCWVTLARTELAYTWGHYYQVEPAMF
jgi:hypothetical protein